MLQSVLSFHTQINKEFTGGKIECLSIFGEKKMNRNRLMRSNSDYVFLGVCGGIAEALLIPSIIVRLVFVFLPVSLVLYLILGALMGKDDSLYGYSLKKKNTFKTVIIAFILSALVIIFFK